MTKTLNDVTENYTYDDADKMLTAGSKSYTYDAAGRTTEVTQNNQTTTLSYDYESRLTQITYPNLSTNTFTYNALDTRVGKVDSAGAKTFKRDGVGVTAPVLSDGAAAYTPGVAERRRGGTSKFYHGDYLNSITRETDSSQNTTATKQYDAFWMPLSSTGSSASPFGFAGCFGYQEDGDSGLKLLGHRYYDPSTGRFLTRDPSKDGRNWYDYCNNRTMTTVDPNGESGIVIIRGPDSDPNDIRPEVDDIIGDYKEEFGTQVKVFDNPDDAMAALADADALIWIGHYDPAMHGAWSPANADLECLHGSKDGSTSVISAQAISRARHGKRFKWIHLVGCNTLSNPANADEWGRLCNGNLQGYYRKIALNWYAWGLVHLMDYEPGRIGGDTVWWGAAKKRPRYKKNTPARG